MGANLLDIQPVIADHWLEAIINGVACRDEYLGVVSGNGSQSQCVIPLSLHQNVHHPRPQSQLACKR